MCKTLGPNLLPRRKLKEILDIPLDSKEEVPGTGNVNARNTMFELSLASRLQVLTMLTYYLITQQLMCSVSA
jgi:hypothetical protein